MDRKKDMKSGIKEIDDYIVSLEAQVASLEGSSIFKLIMACDEVAGIIADDIRLLKENTDDDEIDNKLQMMGSKKNKIYQRYREVVSDIKHFKTIYDISIELKAKSSAKDIKDDTEVITTVMPTKKVKKNIQDFVFDNNE